MICHLCLPREGTESIPAIYAKWQLQKLFAPSALTTPSSPVVPGPTTFAETPVPAVFLAMACGRYDN